jgi:hypothetical protein
MQEKFIMGYQTINKALEKGDCISCVSYYPIITPPFESHCRSTQDCGARTVGDKRIRMCGKKAEILNPTDRKPSQRKSKLIAKNVTIKEYLNSRDRAC